MWHQVVTSSDAPDAATRAVSGPLAAGPTACNGGRVLTLFHDYTSPASAVAFTRLARLAEGGLDVAFEGVDVHGIDAALPLDLEVLAALDDLAEQAEAEGLVLRRPRMLAPTALAHVLGHHATRRGAGVAVARAVYAALWRDGADIADRDVLVDVAVAAGLDAGEVGALLADRVALAAQRRRTLAHRQAGVGGVPVVLASRTLVPGLLDEDQLRALAAAV